MLTSCRTSRHKRRRAKSHARQTETNVCICFWQNCLLGSCTCSHIHVRLSPYIGCEEGTVKIHIYLAMWLCAENNRNPAACGLAVAFNIGRELFLLLFFLHTIDRCKLTHRERDTGTHTYTVTHVMCYSFCLHTRCWCRVCLLVLVSLFFFFLCVLNVTLSSYT